jgi:hypothetical protein
VPHLSITASSLSYFHRHLKIPVSYASETHLHKISVECTDGSCWPRQRISASGLDELRVVATSGRLRDHEVAPAAGVKAVECLANQAPNKGR